MHGIGIATSGLPHLRVGDHSPRSVANAGIGAGRNPSWAACRGIGVQTSRPRVHRSLVGLPVRAVRPSYVR
jgi:hypothetical protein